MLERSKAGAKALASAAHKAASENRPTAVGDWQKKAVDFAATKHITPDKTALENYSVASPVTIAEAADGFGRVEHLIKQLQEVNIETMHKVTVLNPLGCWTRSSSLPNPSTPQKDPLQSPL